MQVVSAMHITKEEVMRKGITLIILSVFAAAVMMAGCGSSKSDYAEGYYTEAAAAEEAPAAEYAAEEFYMEDYSTAENSVDAVAETGDVGTEEARSFNENEAENETQSAAANRKLIRNVIMDVETENLDAMMSSINERIDQYGGYAEYAEVNAGYANITARIPSTNLDAFVNNVAEMSNVTSQTESAEDITLQYVDTKSRVESLKIEQDRLNELLAEADSVDTIIALESRLSEVRYELQSYESQLRTYDNLVDFSTVRIYISEVKTYTAPVEASRWEQMTSGFVESLYGVGEGFLDFVVGFIIALPFIIVWAVIITLIVLIIKTIIKISKRNHAKKLEQRQKRIAEQQQTVQVQQQAAQVQQPTGGQDDAAGNENK